MKYLILFVITVLSVSCSRMIIVADRDTNISIELYEKDLSKFLIMSNRHIIFNDDDIVTDDDVM